MMTQQEYMAWWLGLPDDYDRLDEPVRTLVEHVSALQDRVDALPEYEDTETGPFRCCCAYDHPAAVCTIHASRSESP